MGYVFIAVTVLLTGYAQVILKYEINSVPSMPSGLPMIGFLVKFTLFRPLVLSAFLSGFVASFAWMAALSRFELSYVYPFMSLNFVFVVALSFLLFGEGMHAYKFVGLAVICIGVLIVSKAPIQPQRPQASKFSEVVAAAESALGGRDDRAGGNHLTGSSSSLDNSQDK
ncbi:MAG TPA: EamA family transporter [Dehalococcoidia bacterium]|jgi:drug/metabolite transporter (DMT)-like permease|nr:EamA family transporter [Dehalococcoidia bacterium]